MAGHLQQYQLHTIRAAAKGRASALVSSNLLQALADDSQRVLANEVPDELPMLLMPLHLVPRCIGCCSSLHCQACYKLP